MLIEHPMRVLAEARRRYTAQMADLTGSIHRAVTIRYGACLLAIAVLACSTWRVTSAGLAMHEKQDQTIAIAGAQRMLSHQIAGLLTERIVATDPQEQARAEQELEAANRRLDSAFTQLTNGPAKETSRLQHVYFEGPHSVASAVRLVEDDVSAIKQGLLPRKQAMDFIAWMRGPLISLLDTAVAEHRTAAAQSLIVLNNEQLGHLVLFLIVLALEATIVFAPLARRLMKQTDALVTQARQLTALSADLQELAVTDGLTRLRNRRAFDLEVVRLEAAAPATDGGISHKLGVILLDLDWFKQVNDQFGHAAGDAVLRAVGDRLHHLCRANDFVARIGGDEFVVIVPDVSSAAYITTIAERLRKTLSEPVQYNDQLLKVGASVGTCLVPDQAPTISEAIGRADEALIAEKRHGKSRIDTSWKTLGHSFADEPTQPCLLERVRSVS